MALRTVGVKLTAEVAGYMAGLRQAGTATRGLVGEMDKAARAGHLDAVANQAAGVGLGLLAAGGAAVKFGMDFDKQMSAVEAATHASTTEVERLRKAALQAGQATKYSATEAAQGIEELSKAGVSTSAILSGGLAGALDLAAAGGLDVAEAAETAASAMTQFKLSGQDVPHIADLLAAAAGKAQGSVHDMGFALSQAGLVANQMGLSVEDTTGTLAAFASAGLLGSDAGTSLKTMFLALANPSDKAAETMKQLGINAYDASGQFVGVTNLAGQLRDRLGSLTQEQRNSALATIFGSDAIRAASILYEQGAGGIQSWIDKVNDQGYAAETAAKKTDNLAGDIERLTGSLETLAIESSTGSSAALRTLVQGADNLVSSLSAIPSPVQNAGVIIAGVGGAALLAAAGTAKLRRSSGEALEELSKTGPVGQKAAAGLERTGKAAGRVAIAFAAVQTASALMGDSVNAQTGALGKGMAEFAASSELGGEAARVFGDDLGKLETALVDIADTGRWSSFVRGFGGFGESISGIGNLYDSSLQKSRERLQALDQALAQMVESGKGAEAAAIFKQVADRAAEQGVSVAELNKVLPGYAAALETGAGAATTNAAATGESASAMGDMATEAEKAKEKVDDLKAAFDELFGAQMSIDTATIAYRQGLVDLKTELETGKRTLDTNTQAGRDNAGAVLDQIGKIKDLRDARIAHNGKVDEANGKYKTEIGSLKATLRQMNFNEAQIEALVADYERIPEEANTKVGISGYGPVSERLITLAAFQGALKAGKPMAPIRKDLSQDNADFLKYADGGKVRGYSPHKRADDHLAWVTAREWVHPVDSVDYYGEAAMSAIQHRRIPAEDLRALAQYADGGQVWPYPTTVRHTRIPSKQEVASAVTPGIPTSGATAPAIVAAVRSAFPELRPISTYRPGATTLSGNTSYHALNRAVDYPPSRALAEWWNVHYKPRTKELISPYQDLNILNGRRHSYTGAVWRQHAFGYGNAHDHLAMENGGYVAEPVVGVGLASGRSYSFAERAPEWVIPSTSTVSTGSSAGVTPAVVTALRSDVQRLIRAVEAVAPGVGAELTGAVASAQQIGRAYGWQS